jgi:hypothetical protein
MAFRRKALFKSIITLFKVDCIATSHNYFILILVWIEIYEASHYFFLRKLQLLSFVETLRSLLSFLKATLKLKYFRRSIQASFFRLGIA